ncbi:hypothetical protein [Pseudoalteromonas luteoviolacea]|uniref:hypothetical protein n=1 Tax=Pseudoalteromonas luteoviolacea TaxID=43657 RepID=UPI001B3862D8|nr:hypothetical protein [Pseudoalteromonas luteoviolacea]MBQ4836086.1 hypothetical protein [Pseudoalteromonas luteoviolacea]
MTESELYTFYTAVAASIAAIFSALTAVYQAYTNKKHQHASVMPFLTDDLTVRIRGENSFAIKNQGLGPAVLKEYTCYWNHKVVDHFELMDNLREILGERYIINITALQAGYALGAGDSKYLFKVALKPNESFIEGDLSLANFAVKLASSFRLEIKYHSLFSNKTTIYCSKPTFTLLNDKGE